ncbi:ComEC/Rec2 family competence protein [Marinibacterium sp. SX1]|uniref:ComEC/Rec2 family competence protein n=1 Tax=Marinibacterium sp. SX1 TaxID=3388424 RepID=UPI003D1778FD
MRELVRVETALWGQRGFLFPWSPVCVAAGIGLYFGLRTEPGAICYAIAAGLFVLLAGVAWRWPGAWAPLLTGLALCALGFGLAGHRAHQVGAPRLEFRYYGPVEGRIVALDRSASDAPRMTLDRVVLRDMNPARVPARVRLSLHGPGADLRPGQRVMTTGHLSPPQGPAEPGGFDFRRHVWFQRLGAVGYTRVPVLIAGPPDAEGLAMRIFALRMAVSAHIRARLPGETGGFAAAVTTGDRSGIGQAALEALRASNLAHLLAISGLHMGLLAGVVFSGLRLALALVPRLALRWPIRKMAALGALAAAAVYLALSGGNVATERAFIMVAVALVAVLFDRRALSLRAVALAALIVLALRPEALLSPGFQMSFAATTALVAVFTGLRGLESRLLPGWARPVMGVVLSSAVAGLATAPVAAAHFNALAPYGLVANLVSVPVMGTIVVPAAVVAAILAPLGLEGPALQVMGLGLDWILAVAGEVSSWQGARRPVVAPGPAVLPMLSLGALWVILWQGRARWAGVPVMVVALMVWSDAGRPAVLVADTGGLVGVMTEGGRALSRPRGAGFVAGIWLENDGDLADQSQAAARWPADDDPAALIRRIGLEGGTLIHVAGKRAARQFGGCKAGDLVISTEPLSVLAGKTAGTGNAEGGAAQTGNGIGSALWTGATLQVEESGVASNSGASGVTAQKSGTGEVGASSGGARGETSQKSGTGGLRSRSSGTRGETSQEAIATGKSSAHNAQGCEIYDARRLRDTGSLAVIPGPKGLRIVTAQELSGHRLWNGASPRLWPGAFQ